MQVVNRSGSRSAASMGALGLLSAVTFAIAAVAPANGQLAAGDPGNPPSQTVATHDLAAAHKIRFETTTRYTRAAGRKLAVTESSSTGVVESFTLLSGPMLDARIVPAANGIYYAICPRGARCPYPGTRFARSASDFLPRRQALELAVRTFLETSATVVAVSLPTPRFVLFVVERDELSQQINIAALKRQLSASPARTLAANLRGTVDEITGPRLFVALGLEPTPSGGTTWAGIARWPSARNAPSFALAFDGTRSAMSSHAAFSFGTRTEGPFEAVAPLCASGYAVDLEYRVRANWITGLRRFACSDGSGSVTARTWILGMDEASGYEEGIWKIVEGSGRYETLRGIGTYVAGRSGARDSAGAMFERWEGVADYDASPPLVAISSLRVSELRKPNGTYVVRVGLLTGDYPERSPVDILVTASGRFLLAAKEGTTTGGKASVILRLRPVTGGRTIKLKIVASDRVGNYRTLERTIELR